MLLSIKTHTILVGAGAIKRRAFLIRKNREDGSFKNGTNQLIVLSMPVELYRQHELQF